MDLNFTTGFCTAIDGIASRIAEPNYPESGIEFILFDFAFDLFPFLGRCWVSQDCRWACQALRGTPNGVDKLCRIESCSGTKLWGLQVQFGLIFFPEKKFDCPVNKRAGQEIHASNQ